MAVRPKVKFSGKNRTMDFEEFMGRMEKAMDQEGVTDDLRVIEMEEWFIREDLEVVHKVKGSCLKEEADLV
jgi:hypothetical protein